MGTYQTTVEEISSCVELALDRIEGDFTRSTLKKALEHTAKYYSSVSDECGNEQPTTRNPKARRNKQ